MNDELPVAIAQKTPAKLVANRESKSKLVSN